MELAGEWGTICVLFKIVEIEQLGRNQINKQQQQQQPQEQHLESA